MSKLNVTNSSPKTPAGAVYELAHHTPCAVVAGISGLKEDIGMESPTTRGSSPGSDNVFSKDNTDRYVASLTPTGSTPTNWFELAADLCHSGYLTETRMRRAVDAVRQAVSR